MNVIQGTALVKNSCIVVWSFPVQFSQMKRDLFLKRESGEDMTFIHIAKAQVMYNVACLFNRISFTVL